MSLTLTEAATAKRTSRQAVWLAIGRGELTARVTSGGMWLIEEDARWEAYCPRKYLDRRPRRREKKEDG